MASVDFSWVAGAYRWLEAIVFASTLQNARVCHLESLLQSLADVSCPTIAVVGDGDGRFLAELLKCDREFKVDYIDFSPGMLKLARKCVGGDSRVSWRCEPFEASKRMRYDAITCHFVLDGFGSKELNVFVASISASLKPNGVLLVSDFDSHAHRGAAALVVCMQWFFRIVAGLPAVEVSKPDALLKACNMTKCGESEWWRGAVFSQIWKK